MKVQFEEREKLIIKGFVAMAMGAAYEDKNKKMKKYTKKLVDKFDGEGEVNLKKNEIKDLVSMLNTVVLETDLEVADGELPKIEKADYDTCIELHDKLSKMC